MALPKVSRGCKALTLALAVLSHSSPAFCATFSRQALDNLFDSGAVVNPLVFTAQSAEGRPVSVEPRAVAAAASFHGLKIPAHLFSREQRISKTLVSIIDKTRRKMDLALYVISLPEVADAIVRAKERGVAVRIIMDYSTTFPSGAAPARSKELNMLIRSGVVIATLRGGLMHNKFGIYDGKLVSSGSFNWTELADTKHFENILFRDQPEFLTGFRDYFNWMWIQAVPLSGFPFAVRNRQASDDIEPTIAFKGKNWTSFSFSPKGGTEELVIKAIGRCKKSIDIAMFSFFSEDIARAVVRAKKRGVAVRIVLDKGNARNIIRAKGIKGTGVDRNAAKRLLRENGIDLKFSYGQDGPDGVGILHHKFALFDGEMLETGSFNYSENADNNNYENAIFSTDAEEVRAFAREFEFLYGQEEGPSFSDGLTAEAAALVD
jgi:phosphatidylserine/phosphatidylglycerophosphate/cardiolipin synthase-like enzyme